ncbi:hypothetical protein IFM89_000217 [Coptis chinensis]|uniref:Uncharacterized protein n=1 Tax=Coptis chinensis TaxID=261450 RepID=A0A835I8U5_9MAGN|nr:hypothetical protein IFM89_000217 [Coptis chinensis]
MATVKVKWLVLSIFFAIICVNVNGDSGVETVIASDSSWKLEVEQLKSKISLLELNVEDKDRELKNKDESIVKLEKVVDEKAGSISSLQGEIDLIQKKGSVATEEQVGKAHARTIELEKQVEKLRKEIEAQTLKKNALEARRFEADNRIQELNSKLENVTVSFKSGCSLATLRTQDRRFSLAPLQKINDEQKSRIRKTERALQVAEEEMVKAKLEATRKAKELLEAHGSWLPVWFAIHVDRCQSFATTYWNQHGKPALDVATQKALVTKAQVQKWAEPHMETIKSRWIPAIQEQWVAFKLYAEPHLQSVATKTVEVYDTTKSTIMPHVVRVQELADPYFQEAKKCTKPYIDHVATVTKPHVDKARVALKPYTKKIVREYRKFLKSATTYHNQVQATVQETLNKHELTRPLATKELVWFTASALLALPVLFLPRLFSAIFSKKAKKPVRNTNHTRRRPKRGHPDK